MKNSLAEKEETQESGAEMRKGTILAKEKKIRVAVMLLNPTKICLVEERWKHNMIITLGKGQDTEEDQVFRMSINTMRMKMTKLTEIGLGRTVTSEKSIITKRRHQNISRD